MRVGGIIKSWCSLLFPLLKIKLPLIPAPLMPHQQEAIRSIFPGGLGRALLSLEMQIRSWVARCSHLLCLEAISRWLKSCRRSCSAHLGRCCSALGGKPFCILCPQRNTKGGLSSVPGHAHMLMLARASPPSRTQQGFVPLGCKWPLEGADPPLSYLGQILLLCWRWIACAEKCVAGVNTCGRVPACIFFWSLSQTAFVIHLQWKKNYYSFYWSPLEFSCKSWFYSFWHMEGICKGDEGEFARNALIFIFLSSKSQNFWHVLLRCDSEIRVEFQNTITVSFVFF